MKTHVLWHTLAQRFSFACCTAAQVLIAWPGSGLAAQPLPQAHAHNDYYHARPLLDALERGFCSVEADIFLENGQLLVGHDREELREDRDLRGLYLEPLKRWVQQNHGTVLGPDCDSSLLIDVKSEGDSTWIALRPVLAEYKSMLTTFSDTGVSKRAVTVIISGNRAASLMQAEEVRYAGLDGRISDLTLGLKTTLMPWISDDFTRFFEWDGSGQMPQEELDLLERIVSQAHRLGYRIRFWATRDHPETWQTLREAGVDLIGADDLDALHQFLRTGIR